MPSLLVFLALGVTMEITPADLVVSDDDCQRQAAREMSELPARVQVSLRDALAGEGFSAVSGAALKLTPTLYVSQCRGTFTQKAYGRLVVDSELGDRHFRAQIETADLLRGSGLDDAAKKVAAKLRESWRDLEMSLASPRQVLVLPLKPLAGVDVATAQLLTQRLVAQLGEVRNLKTTSLADVDAALAADKQKQLAGCDDLACMTEITGALGAELVLHGTLGRLGEALALDLSIVRSRDSVAVARYSGSASKDSVAGLVPAAIARLVQKLAELDASR